jgi:hypothetical protein
VKFGAQEGKTMTDLDRLVHFQWYSDGMRPSGSSEPADASGTYVKLVDVEDLLASSSAPETGLRALVEQWRSAADMPGHKWTRTISTLRKCADELDALLASSLASEQGNMTKTEHK